MPVNLKFITMFRGGEGYGWQEVHYKQSTGETPNLEVQLQSYRTNIVPLRAQLLGEDCAIVGFRVSYPLTNETASYGLRDFFPGVSGKTGAAAQLSLAVNFKDATFKRSKIVHLRGFWDVVEYNESYHPEAPEAAGWEDRFIAWKQGLIAGQYGWLTKSAATSSKGTVTTYATEASGHVTFTVAGQSNPLPAAGTLIQVRFSRINKSNSVLNRQILCEVIGPNTLRTIPQIGAGPFTDKGKYNYRAVAFAGYANTGSISVGRRSMGRPLNRTPSRGPVEKLY